MDFSPNLSLTLKLCFFITVVAATLKLCFIFITVPSATLELNSAYPAGSSLAGQNSLLPVRGSISKTFRNIFGDGYANYIFAITVITLVYVFVHMLWNYVEGMKASARGQRICRRFSLAEIQSATNNFDTRSVIGKGGFGQVYKGSIDNGRKTVAVKRLKYSSSQGERQFLAEIKTLSKLRDNNLVSLIGYCDEPGEMILVYKFMTHGSLADHLFKRSSTLSWTQRLNICIGAGRGLNYLHTSHGIIHRDVKSSNILLDKNFVAKVSDFGLARPETRSELQSDVSSNVQGTPGYLDPNYVSTRIPTRESDTYSFGVLLLEILCGRPARDRRAEKVEEYLVTWAQENIRNGEVENIISSNLRGKISGESLTTFVKVAQSCLHLEQHKRPTMGQVVEQLEVALEQQECQTSWGAPVPVPPDEIVVCDAVGLSESTMIEKLTMESSDEQNVASSFKLQTNGKAIAEPKPSTKKELKLSIPLPEGCVELYLANIKEATNGFSDSNIIGAVQHAILYKGDYLSTDGYSTVVKRISNTVYGRKMFETELSLLSKLKHPNIMRLHGYAIDDEAEEMILVYYQFAKTTLHVFLDKICGLSWMLRFKIIVGIAQGLKYLHDYQELRKLYCSHLKPSNILLDEDMNPEIAIDFGQQDVNGGTTTEEFTINNYATPESKSFFYAIDIEDSDVYIFGIIVLEIVSGRRHCISDPTRDIISRTRKLWAKGKVLDLMDPSVGRELDQMQMAQVERCISIGVSCTQDYASDRPLMERVVSSW